MLFLLSYLFLWRNIKKLLIRIIFTKRQLLLIDDSLSKCRRDGIDKCKDISKIRKLIKLK